MAVKTITSVTGLRHKLCLAAVLAALLPGCTSVTTKQEAKARIDVQRNVGFTIEEEVPVSGAARESYQEAHLLFAQQRYAAGATILEEVVAESPQLSAPRIDLAIAYHKMGELDLAEQHLLEALAQNPDHPVALNELGIIYRKDGRFAESRASYERALDIYPGFHRARRNLAVLCDLYIGDMDCALKNYEAYMDTVANDPEVTIWIADIRNRTGG
jgi:tetratricopeptide (TPR) repeat protein